MTPPAKVEKLLERLCTVFPLTVCAAAVVLAMTIPETEGVLKMLVFALAMDKLRTVLLEIVLVPADT